MARQMIVVMRKMKGIEKMTEKNIYIATYISHTNLADTLEPWI